MCWALPIMTWTQRVGGGIHRTYSGYRSRREPRVWRGRWILARTEGKREAFLASFLCVEARTTQHGALSTCFLTRSACSEGFPHHPGASSRLDWSPAPAHSPRMTFDTQNSRSRTPSADWYNTSPLLWDGVYHPHLMASSCQSCVC